MDWNILTFSVQAMSVNNIDMTEAHLPVSQ